MSGSCNPMKLVPAGFSKRKNKPYNAFYCARAERRLTLKLPQNNRVIPKATTSHTTQHGIVFRFCRPVMLEKIRPR